MLMRLFPLRYAAEYANREQRNSAVITIMQCDNISKNTQFIMRALHGNTNQLNSIHLSEEIPAKKRRDVTKKKE
jgi:mannitol-1-phosphate/altronate dehydrogenase